METLINNLRVEDIPAPEARPFKALGVIGQIESREVSNGYVQVTVPLTYRLNTTDTQDRTFYAKINIKPAWLTPGAERAITEDNERISYNINVKGLMRGLFTAAGINEGAMDFQRLTGRVVGFKTKPQKKDPTRLEIGYFFAHRN